MGDSNGAQALSLKLLQEKYGGRVSEDYYRDVKRLERGEPYEYVRGCVDFLGAQIDLSYTPMIPRPETAFWVERAIRELAQKDGPLRLADTFSGAGNVGVVLLKHLPRATVDFFELDAKLKPQIEKNIAINGIDPARTRVVTASALEGLTGTYDAIFAVPPYVPYEALSELDPEMINFEPHLAFFAHDDGHEFHKLLIEKGITYLREGGTLYMEADYDDTDFIAEYASRTPWRAVVFWEDPYGATPNVVLRK